MRYKKMMVYDIQIIMPKKQKNITNDKREIGMIIMRWNKVMITKKNCN